MDADDEPDEGEVGSAVGHVQRRHHHDADHGDVPERDDEHPEPGPGDAADDAQPAAYRAVGLGVAAGAGQATGLEQRVGAEPDREEADGQGEPDAGEEERAGETRQAERIGHRFGRADEVGPEHAADRGGPDDETEVSPPVRGVGEV
ncbi:MAG: hypothetical protein ACRCZD_22460, partial [Phycicoccus sp.]